MIDPKFNGLSPIGVSMGEPSGIGSEIALKSWLENRNNLPPFYLIDDPERIRKLASDMFAGLNIVEIDDPYRVESCFSDALPLLPVGEEVTSKPGQPDLRNASAVCRSIEMGVEACLNNRARALITLPIQKNTLYEAGFSYPGHTEYLGSLCGLHKPVMMLASPMLRVVPVTIHTPLKEAIAAMTKESIVETATTTARALSRDFGIPLPRMAIAGLNPHAGEDGNLGEEDQQIILPAIQALKECGFSVSGPVPPDALFTPRQRETYDVAICHYHDQALIPIKALDVDNAVNVTLGLSIIRTSPDHGTALDIAGTGFADPSSFMAALKLADQMARNRVSASTE